MRIMNRIEVSAPAEVLWEVLADPTQWPRWTSSITSLELLDGVTELDLGHRVRIVQPGLRSSVWTVVEHHPGSAFTWESEEGGVRTTATHAIVRHHVPSHSHLVLELQQHGLLAPVVGLVAGARIRRYVEMEGVGLGAEAERRLHKSPAA
ncbi:MAG TPA: SRPBCC family protein [Ornithinicoccus sp.]|nr:SRPBCC family protein [Ornithinicoccus sp.]